jgi:CHAT domain-containing protein/Tfp pilus assembly protein PilF
MKSYLKPSPERSTQVSFFILAAFFLVLAAGLAPAQNNPSLSSLDRIFQTAEHYKIDGDFEKAISYYKDALQSSQVSREEPKVVLALIQLGVIYWNVNNIDDSSRSFATAHALALRTGDTAQGNFAAGALRAIELFNEGREFDAKGKTPEAIATFNKAVEAARAITSPDLEVKCLRWLCVLLWDANQHDSVYRYAKEGLNIARKTRNKFEEGRLLVLLGMYFWKTENYSISREHYEQGLTISQQIDDLQNINYCKSNLAVLYLDLGNFTKALEYFNNVLNQDIAAKDRRAIAIDYLNIGATYRKRAFLTGPSSDYDKALNALNQSLQIAQDINYKKIIIKILNNIGTVHSDRGRYLDARNCFKTALEIVKELNDTDTEGKVLTNLGIIEFSLGNYEVSTGYYQSAIDIAFKLGSGQDLWEAYLELGNAMAKQQKYEEALKNYQASVSIIEDIRSTINLEEYKASFLGTSKRLEAFQNLIALLIRLNKEEPDKGYIIEAFNYLERGKARAFLDSLEVTGVDITSGIDFKLANQEKEIMHEISLRYSDLLAPELKQEERQKLTAEIKGYEERLEALKAEVRSTSPAYANLKYPEIITYDRVRRELNDRLTAFFAYSVGKDQSFCFAVAKNRIRAFSLPGRAVIQQQVADYRRAISDRDNHDFGLGRTLYKELIEPGLADIGSIRRIIIVPDDVLHLLPFETLVVNSENPVRWLVEDYEIAYTPSLSSLRYLERRKRSGPRPGHDLLALGDPYYGPNEDLSQSANPEGFFSGDPISFERLRYAGQEVQSSAALFKPRRETVFLRREASEENVKSSNLLDYKIIHFATHGLIDDQRPGRSAIILAIDEDPTEDGLLQMREIFNVKMTADLVALSACQTGLGQSIRGEGIEGLSRAFFYAGASSVLMSLWSVNDEATSQLMERFYYHLLKGKTSMSALQQTKRELISSDVLSHPFYWAGFILSGRARQRVFASGIPFAIPTAILVAVAAIFLGLRFRSRRRQTSSS